MVTRSGKDSLRATAKQLLYSRSNSENDNEELLTIEAEDRQVDEIVQQHWQLTDLVCIKRDYHSVYRAKLPDGQGDCVVRTYSGEVDSQKLMALDNEHSFLDWVSSQGCLVSKIIEPSVKLSPYVHHFAVRVMTYAYGCSPFYLQD